MEKTLILPRYKSDFLYIVLVSVVAYLGSYFGGNFFPDSSIGYKLLCHFLLLVNSGVVYLLITKITIKEKLPLLFTCLYLIIPSQLDYFLFTYQVQLLGANTLLLLSLWCLFSFKERESFILLALAAILNAKLVLLYLPFLYFKKTNLTQKLFVFSHFAVNLVFYEPYFKQSQKDLIFNPSNVFYGLEDLFSPLHRSVLDMSLTIPGYHDRLFMIGLTALFLLVAFFYLNKKEMIGKISAIFVLVTFISTFVPVNFFLIDYDTSIYTNINTYPLLLCVTLLLLVKFAEKSKLSLGIVLAVSCLWIFKDINFQKETLNVVGYWNEMIFTLPESYNNEEKIKLTYTKILIDNGEHEVAERFVNQARFKFPNETWYNLSRSLAARRQDQKAIDNLDNDLYLYKIPFHID